MQRGKIYNRERAQQLRDFSGLRFGDITPTDIDGLVEFNDTLFVYFEAKRIGTLLPRGQKLALTRQCDAINGTKNFYGKTRIAALIVIEHDTSPDQDVDYAQLRVKNIYQNRRWTEPKKDTSCREAVEDLLTQAGLAQRYIR